MTLIAAAVAMIAGVGMDAQVRYGILGGFTSSSADANAKVGKCNLYHVGFAAKIPVGAGFAVQPGITYQMKGASLEEIAGDILIRVVEGADIAAVDLESDFEGAS